ncbi:MAG TPA: hypothetical protein VLF91_00420 [Candidatus Saccharimonadales bacterium]|nr:hypothetical protein [Candidatus Saccharimonadales bacterium]
MTAKYKIAALITSLASLVLAITPIASAHASGWYCGSQCNGQTPTWVVPSNGIQCSNSATQISSGHPSGGYELQGVRLTDGGWTTTTDTTITVKLMYSTVCRTIWAVISNSGLPSNVDSRSSCVSYMYRTIPTTWGSPNYGCPGVGGTLTTKMADNQSPSGGVAGHASIVEVQMRNDVCVIDQAHPGFCRLDGDQPVTLGYYPEN